MDRFSITDDDRERMGNFLNKSYLDRTASDLLPEDDEGEEE